MLTESELLGTLDANELKSLVASATNGNARAVLERDLRYRREEIELELSKTTAARDAALASHRSAANAISERTQTGSRGRFLTIAVLVGSLLALSALATLLIDWPFGHQVLASWNAPFASGWLIGAIWGAFYAAVPTIALETDFFLRRLPARRRAAEREVNLSALLRTISTAESGRRAQLVELVRDHVTEILNANQGPRFASELHMRSDHAPAKRHRLTVGVGLSEVFNDDNRVATDVQQRLMQLIINLSGASIGISGPRGVGKSTLLAAICGANPTINRRPAIAISTSAPVEYDGRDFLLHLFSSLCRQVLRTEGEKDATLEADALYEARNWRRASMIDMLRSFSRLLGLLGASLMLVAIGLAAFQSFTSMSSNMGALGNGTSSAATSTPGQPAKHVTGKASPTPLPSPSPAAAPASTPSIDGIALFKALGSSPLFTLGVLATILSFVLFFARASGLLQGAISTPKARFRSYMIGERYELVELALRELRNIAFQRSYTSGWSGGLKMPAGFDLGGSAGLTLAQIPESLPELVERFRSFVSEVARAYENVVIIGIDELDKLKTAQQAEGFLNGLKSVFGIPNCFYLISVSEHALAAFERRGIGFRDAFDSALDDVLQLDFLNLDQSRVLLNRRILRLPDPFVQLCHMLSGGLPRDLIRHARALLDCASERPRGAIGIRKAVDHLAARDLTARLRATSIAMRSVSELPETSDLLVEVAALPADATIARASTALASFKAHVSGLSSLRDSEDGRLLLRLAEELGVYYEVMIQLRRVAALLSTSTGWKRTSEFALANKVASVRQALEVSVPLAKMRLIELVKSVDDAAVAIDRIVNPRPSRVAP